MKAQNKVFTSGIKQTKLNPGSNSKQGEEKKQITLLSITQQRLSCKSTNQPSSNSKDQCLISEEENRIMSPDPATTQSFHYTYEKLQVLLTLSLLCC